MSRTGLLRVTHDGTTLTFTPDEVVTIGRHVDSAVYVASRRVSRHHARVSWKDGRWTLEDLDSVNGTYVDGLRISNLEIDHAVKLALGDADGPGVTLNPVVSEPATPERTISVGSNHGAGATRSSRHSANVITIGRATDNDVVVDDPSVSWHHAEIRGPSREDQEIVDLNSHNGTYLNGERITRAQIRELDRVTIGDRSYRFRAWNLEPIS